MNDLIAVVAVAIFFVSSYLIYDLFKNGFNIYILLGAIVGFIVVHFIWPKTRDGESAWYESLEFLFDLPYRSIAFFLRAFSLKSGKSDFDIDL